MFLSRPAIEYSFLNCWILFVYWTLRQLKLDRHYSSMDVSSTKFRKFWSLVLIEKRRKIVFLFYMYVQTQCMYVAYFQIIEISQRYDNEYMVTREYNGNILLTWFSKSTPIQKKVQFDHIGAEIVNIAPLLEKWHTYL